MRSRLEATPATAAAAAAAAAAGNWRRSDADDDAS